MYLFVLDPKIKNHMQVPSRDCLLLLMYLPIVLMFFVRTRVPSDKTIY